MSEIHDAAAAYALDALDPAEQAEFEAHLAGCADCAAEVAELREVTSRLVLSSATAPPPPPPALRASILAAITDVDQLPRVPGRPRRAMPSSETEEIELADLPAAPAVEPVVDELALRRARRPVRVLSVLVAAVTVVALALGGVVWSLARQDQAPIATPPVTQTPQVDPSLLAAPDARIRRATLTNGAEVSFVVSKSQNRAAFVSTDLPSPGTGNEYHLWTLKGDTVVRPDTTLQGGTNVVQLFTGPVDDSTALAVNVEPTGSKPTAPTTPVLGAVSI